MCACKKAEVRKETFHDLRPAFVINARRAGIDSFRVMTMTRHKTMAVFKRYNTVEEADLRDTMHLLASSTATKIATDAIARMGSGPIICCKHTPGRRSSAGRATDS